MVEDFVGKEINVGDLVMRVGAELRDVPKGSVHQVISVDERSNSIKLEGVNHKGPLAGEFFAVVQKGKPIPEKVRSQYKHTELVKAWLDGYPIQLKNQRGKWEDYHGALTKCVPPFFVNSEYRIKPVESEKDKLLAEAKALVQQAEALVKRAEGL